MSEPQNTMPIKHIVDSNIVCDPSHGEILLGCADTWVDEDSLLTSYQEIIESHWIKQGIIKIEEEYLESEDVITKSVIGEYKSGNGDILLSCADTWVNEASLLSSYEEIIQSHWIEQGVIEVEEKYLKSKHSIIISGEHQNKHKNGGTSSSMQMDEMSGEQSSNYDERECELRHTQCESANSAAVSSELDLETLHTDGKSFTCELPQKGLSEEGNLNIYNLTHSCKKQYNYTECLKRFTRKCSVVVQKLTHSSETPYKHINVFSPKCHLIKHKLTHTGTGKKTLKCEECQKRFSLKSNLNLHKLIHTGEKTFKCDECQKNFS